MKKIIFTATLYTCILSGAFAGIHKKNKKNLTPLTDSTLCAYDSATLNRNTLPVLMPYNRIIDPAGKVVKYGSPRNENHSLDIIQLPDTNLYAVEDRFGIAILNPSKEKILQSWSYAEDAAYKGLMSTYSGIQAQKIDGKTHLFWSAANGDNHQSKVIEALWDGKSIQVVNAFDFLPEGDSPLALPNELALSTEGGKLFMYVVLNGNNKLEKIDLASKTVVWSAATGVAPYGIVLNGSRAYVTNWGGDVPTDSCMQETAGVPYGKANVDPATGATNSGSVSVFNTSNGDLEKVIPVGLHPNDIIQSHNGYWIFVSNGNSDNISVIDTENRQVIETIPVKIYPQEENLIGDSPNAMAISKDDSILYVANGMDNALAVVKLNLSSQNSRTIGFIPTEAYPGGVTLYNNKLLVTNLEGEGARINSREMDDQKEINEKVASGAYNSHRQKATISIIPIPDSLQLDEYTQKVKQLMLGFRIEIAKSAPRKKQPERPMPERLGEPSVFKHVIYIIKENRTYDQVMGDDPNGNGNKDLCVFGDSVTPNQHQLANDFLLLDNYYASGKCSAEGHQWTDAAMVTDYVEKNVRAWFRSYPHVQNDAMVYNRKGFIWDNAALHGKTVRIYGEACEPELDPKDTWLSIYTDFLNKKPLNFKNKTTIASVKPHLSSSYPGYDSHRVPDVLRAQAFIDDLNKYEKKEGDSLPNLMILALPADHTAGTNSRFPTPRAMVADNDLALGQIIEAVSKSRFWKNTVIFVTEDDSQNGWDHVSAYRTTGFVISPYSRLHQTISMNYNQTSMMRSIEQILGIPPMNLMDATARPMTECFNEKRSLLPYHYHINRIPLNEMNFPLASLKGKALYYARESMQPEYEHVDAGNDNLLNRIIWFATKGKAKYPSKFAGHDKDDDDD